MHRDGIVINGVNGVDGGYLVPPLTADSVIEILSAQPAAPNTIKALGILHDRATVPRLGVPFDVDERRVDQAGWGVVFHANEDARIKKAFAPLIAHRERQQSKPGLVKILEYAGESVADWLAKYRVGLGAVRPDRVPFYLLLAGSPERIPFEFGHILDVDYAVGRLHFDDPSGYDAYVRSVIEYETQSIANRREVVFWGPKHPDDPATELSADHLVQPLATGADEVQTVAERLDYRTRYYAPSESTKSVLHGVFHTPRGQPVPAAIFTASHGVGWPLGHERQMAAQGALVCQDFAGPGSHALGPEHYFAASDLGSATRVHGMVCFHFACFSAGTPRHDRFFHESGEPQQIAAAAHFSPLPQALLSHANGGALGVFGHVDRAWACSFMTPGAGSQLLPFENTLGYLLSGLPLGYCLRDFNAKYAALSTTLTALLERRKKRLTVETEQLCETWTERNDAEGYVLFGDPGARIRIDALSV